MARAVASAIAESSVLVAEAGTGTGKTFAYLAPALRSGGKVIVSTGTKTLQDQLFDRDIPLVRAALKVPVTVALLKGRANYVCHYHLERRSRTGASPPSGCARSHRDCTLCAHEHDGRSRGLHRGLGIGCDMVAGHIHARELPRLGLSPFRPLLRHSGAQTGTGGGCGRRKPSSFLRGSGVARRRRRRAPARLQYRSSSTRRIRFRSPRRYSSARASRRHSSLTLARDTLVEAHSQRQR